MSTKSRKKTLLIITFVKNVLSENKIILGWIDLIL